MVRLPGMDRCSSFVWLCDLVHFRGNIASPAQLVPDPLHRLRWHVLICLCKMERNLSRGDDLEALDLGCDWSRITCPVHGQKHSFTTSLPESGWILFGLRSPLVGRDLWVDGCAPALCLTRSGHLAGIYPLALDHELAREDPGWSAGRMCQSAG